MNIDKSPPLSEFVTPSSETEGSDSVGNYKNGALDMYNTSSNSDNQDVILIDDSSSDSNITRPAFKNDIDDIKSTLNSNDVTTSSSKACTSILENFLTRPFAPGISTTETNQLNVDNRRVEPLKINLNREPIKTVIKVPPLSSQEQQHSPKITIKPLRPPSNQVAEDNMDNTVHYQHKLTVKHSVENCTISGNKAEGSESHTVPKLTIKLGNHHHHHHSKTSNHQNEGIVTSEGKQKKYVDRSFFSTFSLFSILSVIAL